MDLARFVSLLTTQSLYFACPTEFDDPYEGLLPRSHAEAVSSVLQGQIDQSLSFWKEKFATRAIPSQYLDTMFKAHADQIRMAPKTAASRFGVSCWHESEYESDAMWRLYSTSGQGIAIESTVEQLKTSLGDRKGLQIDRVRYMDFDRDPIEKGHKRYALFIKRKSFEHERELRAAILLPGKGKGVLVKCNLETLVTRVHVSPLIKPFVKDAIEALCNGTAYFLNKPVCQSPLYRAPDYGIDVRTK